MGAMPVGCYKQMNAIKEGVIMRLQCSRFFMNVLNGPLGLNNDKINRITK